MSLISWGFEFASTSSKRRNAIVLSTGYISLPVIYISNQHEGDRPAERAVAVTELLALWAVSQGGSPIMRHSGNETAAQPVSMNSEAMRWSPKE
jgi:hypothetical protein